MSRENFHIICFATYAVNRLATHCSSSVPLGVKFTSLLYFTEEEIAELWEDFHTRTQIMWIQGGEIPESFKIGVENRTQRHVGFVAAILAEINTYHKVTNEESLEDFFYSSDVLHDLAHQRPIPSWKELCELTSRKESRQRKKRRRSTENTLLHKWLNFVQN